MKAAFITGHGGKEVARVGEHPSPQRQPGAERRRLFIRQLRVSGSTPGTLAEFASRLKLAEGGRLQPVIDSRHPLDAVPEALSRLESHAQFGKVVVDIVAPGG